MAEAFYLSLLKVVLLSFISFFSRPFQHDNVSLKNQNGIFQLTILCISVCILNKYKLCQILVDFTVKHKSKLQTQYFYSFKAWIKIVLAVFVITASQKQKNTSVRQPKSFATLLRCSFEDKNNLTN